MSGAVSIDVKPGATETLPARARRQLEALLVRNAGINLGAKVVVIALGLLSVPVILAELGMDRFGGLWLGQAVRLRGVLVQVLAVGILNHGWLPPVLAAVLIMVFSAASWRYALDPADRAQVRAAIRGGR